MKAYLFTLCLFLNFSTMLVSQNFDFDKAWQDVEVDLSKGLPQSALEKIKIIKANADNLGHSPHLIKALVYQVRHSVHLNEHALDTLITTLQIEIENNVSPTKEILTSYLADLYLNYYIYNRWSIAQITTFSREGDHFKTWNSQEWLEKIESLYLQSVSNPKNLLVPLQDYSIILTEHSPLAYREKPTIYELLSDKVLVFLKEYAIQQNLPSNNPIQSDINLFAPLKSFLDINLTSSDKKTPFSLAIQMFQTVLFVNSSRNNTTATYIYDAERLKFVYENSNIQNKSELYKNALEVLMQEAKDDVSYTHIAAKYANLIIDPKNSEGKNIALDLCRNALELHPDGIDAFECQSIIRNILAPYLQVNVEQVNVKKRSILYALHYNNIDNVSVKVFKHDKSIKAFLHEYRYEDLIGYLKNKKAEYSEKLELVHSSTYDKQWKEHFLPKLNFGQYILFVEGNTGQGQQTIQFAPFIVSDISVTTWSENEQLYFKVVNRWTGKPIQNALIELTELYNYDLRTQKSQQFSHRTNKDGFAFHTAHSNSNYTFTVKKGKDHFDISAHTYIDARYNPEERYYAEIYTDRAIYRPGQHLHYKALLLKEDIKRIPSIQPNVDGVIALLDANYQKIAEKNFKSNDFGSIEGTFVLPEGKLPGMYTLLINTKGIHAQSQKNIQVEEYKRPTFEILIDELDKGYTFNDTITVSGKAMSLAGTPLSDIQVRYRIVRKPRFFYYWWRIMPQVNEVELVNSNTTTDRNGQFTIDFVALRDVSNIQDENLMSDYFVYIDAVDSRGESRSTELSLHVMSKRFYLQSSMPASIDKLEIKPLLISAKNSNHQIIDVVGTIKIEKLKEPKVLQISKYWSNIIEHPIPLNDRKIHFPQYQNSVENLYASWELEKNIGTFTFNTKSAFTVPSNLQYGVYKVTISSEDVEHIEYWQITDRSNKKYPMTQALFAEANKTSYSVGDIFTLNIGSNQENIYLETIIAQGTQKIAQQSVTLKGNHTITFPIDESHRGGFTIILFYHYQNREFTKRINVDVPWSSKELDIVFQTFRDKTLPGVEEEYAIKISGNKKDVVFSELLMSMYDASLDFFMKNQWNTNFYPSYYFYKAYMHHGFGNQTGYHIYSPYNEVDFSQKEQITYPFFIPIADVYNHYHPRHRNNVKFESLEMAMSTNAEADMEDVRSKSGKFPPPNVGQNMEEVTVAETNVEKNIEKTLQPRANLNETVFFFPNLKTDSEGNIIVRFKMNEALTKWRLMSMAHTKDLEVGYDERYVQTQKDLMVFPNAPRFFRDGDELEFTTRIDNMTNQSQKGKIRLQLWDAITMNEVTAALIGEGQMQTFDIGANDKSNHHWFIKVPHNIFKALVIRVTADGEHHSDAEEITLPVITDQVLITESFSFWLNGNTTRQFIFEDFKRNPVPNERRLAYTLEYTANPIWLAIQALPYLHSNQYATTTGLSDRFFANSLAAHIADSNQEIKKVFDRWKNIDKNTLKSQLNKNEELKNILLQETPWVRQSLSEEEQKHNIALLFDVNKIAQEKSSIIAQLSERQLGDGSFTWLPQGRPNAYITQNVLENFAHLLDIGVIKYNEPNIANMITNALNYLDNYYLDAYTKLLNAAKDKPSNLDDYVVGDNIIHYLYVRSFFVNTKPKQDAQVAIKYFTQQVKKNWLKYPIYTQALIGMILYRNQDNQYANIARSLRQKATFSNEMGLYWNAGNGFNWYDLPIERHSSMIAFFTEIQHDKDEVNKMKVWLMKQKQATHWKTSSNTVKAIYALLLAGEDKDGTPWITEKVSPVIIVGDELVNTSTEVSESGTGYIKNRWNKDQIKPEFAKIKVTNNNNTVAWGAAYYQYFEKMGQVKSSTAEQPLSIKKNVFVRRVGQESTPVNVTPSTDIVPGDDIIIRIDLVVDRNMEYIFIKDHRPSGCEPIDVLSGYKYQGNLSYYQTIKDLSTHFYIEWLPKGTYVIEYTMKAVHKGKFAGGFASAECMYAPEFSSHSEGVIIKVK